MPPIPADRPGGQWENMSGRRTVGLGAGTLEAVLSSLAGALLSSAPTERVSKRLMLTWSNEDTTPR
jgi:hypothetical protein